MENYSEEIILPMGKRKICNHVIITKTEFPFHGITQKFLPNPTIALVFHYGDELSYSLDNVNFVTLPKQYVVTPFMADSSLFFKFGKTLKSAIFVMKPSAYFYLRKKYSSCKPDIFSSQESCLGQDLKTKLIDAFYPVIDVKISINNVMDVFSSIKIENSHTLSIIDKSFKLIDLSHGTLTVMQLADNLNISVRTLERYFVLNTGISPAKYSRIVRFFVLLHSLINVTNGSKTELIEKLNLTDYSHLHKEFKKFTSETPNKYLKNLNTSYYFEKQFLKPTMSGIYKD
ncbi:MAG: AraC family transcriptional regulator [Bacteroidales bacterium]|nr:AraC family transcriptional regulator [Bacteroidales bacterium]